ncbi:MAG TPA: putative zinc-binding protein [Terriglobia bacterium]|nr:putative zinc-binding protein [Terriglobia bacterium]
MPELPRKKVGIIACSGEEIPEGTVTRLAALKVLESLRPRETVTICLPLFLAGGKGDRAFARFYPTIALDGCDKRCAARGTEMYSGKPAVSIVVGSTVPANSAGLGSARRLSEAGLQVVSNLADEVAQRVDQLLDLKWDRRSGGTLASSEPQEEAKPHPATCSCGSGIPVGTLQVAGRKVTLVALPQIFSQFCEAGKIPGDLTRAEVLEAVRIYNPVPEEEEAAYAEALVEEYGAFCRGSS